MRAVSRFDTFLVQYHPLPWPTLPAAHFSCRCWPLIATNPRRADNNTFLSHYDAVLLPYKINTANSAAVTAPKKYDQKIYVAVQYGVPTIILQWHQSVVGKGTQILQIHLMSTYFPLMGIPESPWDDL